jgi:hypothetical protein
MDSLDLLLGCKEMNILISLCHYNTSSRVSEYFAGGICSALDFKSANTEGRSGSLLSSRFIQGCIQFCQSLTFGCQLCFLRERFSNLRLGCFLLIVEIIQLLIGSF